MKDKIRLFVDMDGTVATFYPIDNLERLWEQGYFKNLKPMKNMVEAIQNIALDSKDIEVFILSSVLNSDFAMKEKNEWLDNHIPVIDQNHRIFCKYGIEKSTYITNPRSTDVLLDDYTKNLNEWHGIGIKILNGINDTNKSWEGQRISSFLEPNILTYTIKNTMLTLLTKNTGLKKSMDKAIKQTELNNKNVHFHSKVKKEIQHGR